MQGSLTLKPNTQIKKIKCEVHDAPEPASPCEVVATDGAILGFPADGQETRLPRELHQTIDWVATQAGYQLSLYTWNGSPSPFAAMQGSLNLKSNTQIKKIKCEAL